MPNPSEFRRKPHHRTRDVNSLTARPQLAARETHTYFGGSRTPASIRIVSPFM